MKKRILSVMLALFVLMCICALTVSVSADTGTATVTSRAELNSALRDDTVTSIIISGNFFTYNISSTKPITVQSGSVFQLDDGTANITVEQGGILKLNCNDGPVRVLNGTLVNNGTVTLTGYTRGPYYIKSDITNNGTIELPGSYKLYYDFGKLTNNGTIPEPSDYFRCHIGISNVSADKPAVKLAQTELFVGDEASFILSNLPQAVADNLTEYATIQWRNSNNGNISGANGMTYTTAATDRNAKLNVKITWKTGYKFIYINSSEYINVSDFMEVASADQLKVQRKVTAVQESDITWNTDNCVYNRYTQKPVPTVVVDGKTLTKGSDFTLSYGSNNINAGENTGEVTITFSGDYSGTYTKNFTIKPCPAVIAWSVSSGMVMSQQYNGLVPDVTAKIDNFSETRNGLTAVVVSEPDGMNVGEHMLTVTGFTGSDETLLKNYTLDGAENLTFTYRITPRPFNHSDWPVNIVLSDNEGLIYNGQAQTVTVTASCEERTDAGKECAAETLVEGTDYTLSYDNNINAGRASVTITGIGNFEGTVTKSFTIDPKVVSAPTIELAIPADGYVYDGTAKTPDVVVKDGDTVIPATEYRVDYTYNVNAGTATVTITDNTDGNYTVSGTANFIIEQKDISGANIKLGSSLTYNENEQTQTIESVTIDGLDVTYTVSGNTGTNAGDYELTVTGTGNFKGTQTAAWSIEKATFTADVADYDGIYDGNAHSISVTANGATITYSEDGINYSDVNPAYTNAGTYTVYYKAEKENYYDVTGTATVNIAKATPTLTIKPSHDWLWGGGRVTFTVTGAPEEGSYTITSNPAINANPDNSFILPNFAQEYVFTVTYAESANYLSATADCNVTVTTYFFVKPLKNYQLTFDTNGGAAVPYVIAVEGTIIDLTKYSTDMEGYTFDGWYSDAALNYKITSVSMTENTTVYAGFTEIVIPEVPETEETVENPFKDISESDWYYEDVMFVYENDLMNGTAEDLTMFSPKLSTTRGMIITILYRLEGEPSVKGLDNPFTDLTQSWYRNAVKWGVANDIILGYGNGKYGPEDYITREQLTAILYRYAQYKGYDVSAGEDTNILSYADFDEISEYAIPAMQWACGEDIADGYNGCLTPKSEAKRFEVAAMLHRFCDKYSD